MFPPGRASDATRPEANGSPAGANTIGISDVALLTAKVGGVPDVKMTCTFERTHPAAISAKRCGATHPYSIARVRPSTQPERGAPSRGLRMGGERPGSRAADERDELAAPHVGPPPPRVSLPRAQPAIERPASLTGRPELFWIDGAI